MMTTLKHTPGPWKFYPKYGGENCAAINAQKSEVAEVFGSLTTDNILTEQEAIANAKLIAAAPDLLQACQDAFFVITTNLHQVNLTLDDVKILPIYKRLESAIKKATE